MQYTTAWIYGLLTSAYYVSQKGIQAVHTVPTCYGYNECNDRIHTEHGFHSSCDLPLRRLWMLFAYFRQFGKWKTSSIDSRNLLLILHLPYFPFSSTQQWLVLAGQMMYSLHSYVYPALKWSFIPIILHEHIHLPFHLIPENTKIIYFYF